MSGIDKQNFVSMPNTILISTAWCTWNACATVSLSTGPYIHAWNYTDKPSKHACIIMFMTPSSARMHIVQAVARH